MSRSEHVDVAAYALGVLDDRDSALFEEHLATCWSCAGELESLLPVVNLLSDVDPEDLATAERVTTEPHLLDGMLATVAQDRRRTRSRRMYRLAAGFVLVAMLTGAALFAGGRWTSGPFYVARSTPPPASASPAPTGTTDTGFGGPELPAGERLSAIDAGTGVKTELLLEARPFGTQVSFALSRVTGPRTCRLVVLRKDGSTEAISSWKVPAAGYGTEAKPAPLMLQAATAVPRSEIQEIQVQQIGPDGATTPLVSVRA